MKKIFFFPIIHLVIEFLNEECVCNNNIENNIFNMYLTCKEIHNYIKEYKLLKIGYKNIPYDIKNYFNINYHCLQHNKIKIESLEKIFKEIRLLKGDFNLKNISNNKEKYKIYDIFKIRDNLDNCRYIHDNNKNELLEIKNYMNKNNKNIEIDPILCCSGSGFGIKMLK